MKKLFVILLAFGILALGARGHADTDVDLDSNSAVDVGFGGTNATTAAAARTNLGVVPGTDVQDWDTDLDSLSTPTAWRMFYSDAADPFVQEITLGADGTFLESNGASAAPAFRALLAGDIPDISATYQPLESTLTDIADGTIAENLVNTAYPWADNEVASAITTTATVLDDSDISGDNISAAQATDGTIITNDGKGGAADYNIPAGVKGMVVYVFAEEAQVIVLDLADSDDIITLIDGTALAAGNAIDSDGAFHSSIKLVCHVGDGGTAVSYWYVHSQVGVWVDGGAD